MFPKWADEYYALYPDLWVAGTEPSKRRVPNELPFILKHLPRKSSKVLDLCCGGGIYVFELEKAGYAMTGVDIQKRMIDRARRFGKMTRSRSKFIVGDAKSLKFRDGSFDAVVFLGAAITHFSIQEFLKIAKEAFRVVKRKGVMISAINDHIRMMMERYQRVLYEPSGEKDVISIHTRYDGENGTYNRIFVNLENSKKFKGEFRIWAPWILRHVMEEVGFRFKATEGLYANNVSLDVHEKP